MVGFGVSRWVAALIAAGLLETTSVGEPLVHLQNVPDQLILPVPEGNNQLLTASIHGKPALRVWLAPTRESELRVPLIGIDDQLYQINLAESAVLDALRRHSGEPEFRVFAETGEGSIVESVTVRYLMCAAPLRLDLESGVLSLLLSQRSITSLPGSRGTLKLRLGDITSGYVSLELSQWRGESPIPRTLAREGDTLQFALAEQQYVLHVEKMTNVLWGEDYVVLSVSSLPTWNRQSIEQLLQAIAKVDATFIRNDQQLPPAQFAALLRQKLAVAPQARISVDDFIEQIATRSSTTGKTYEIALQDGTVMPVADWLRQQRGASDRDSAAPPSTLHPD